MYFKDLVKNDFMTFCLLLNTKRALQPPIWSQFMDLKLKFRNSNVLGKGLFKLFFRRKLSSNYLITYEFVLCPYLVKKSSYWSELLV